MQRTQRGFNRQVAKNAKIKAERFNTRAQWHKDTERKRIAKSAKFKAERKGDSPQP